MPPAEQSKEKETRLIISHKKALEVAQDNIERKNKPQKQ
jgi:hypothetical protein